MKGNYFICFIWLPALLVFYTSNVSAQGKWSLKKDEEGIKVYGRSSATSKYDEMKVETDLSATLSSLTALVLDIDHYVLWSFNNKQSYLIKQVSPSELYFYSEIKAPWPMDNRDIVSHLSILQSPATHVLTIRAEAAPTLIPVKKGLVRVPVCHELWTVTPLNNGAIRVVYEISIDPGGNAPAWLVNNFSTKGPYETFVHIKERLRGADYRNAQFSFIKN